MMELMRWAMMILVAPGQRRPQTAADVLVGGHIHGGGGVVQDQDLGLFQDGPGDQQPLALAAGQVGGVLLQHRLIPVGEPVDVLVGRAMAQAACIWAQGGVGVRPAEVVGDGAGEQGPFCSTMDTPAQIFQGILPDVPAVHLHGAGQGVVKPGDQAHQGGLALAGAADNADGLAGGDVQGHMAQGQLVGVPGIAEADVLKVHAAAFHCGVGGAVGDVDFLVQHLVDADQGRLGPGQGHHQPADHGQGVHRHTGVVHQAHQLAGQQAGGPENDLPAAEKQNQHAAHPHNAHGNGAGQGKQSPCAQLGPAQVIGGFVKPLGLIPPPNVGFTTRLATRFSRTAWFMPSIIFSIRLNWGWPTFSRITIHTTSSGDTRQQQGRKTRGDDEAHDRGQDHHHRGPVQGSPGTDAWYPAGC